MIILPSDPNDDFGFGTGDFAVEGWIIVQTFGNRTLFDFRGGADGDTAPSRNKRIGGKTSKGGGVQQITGGPSSEYMAPVAVSD